MTSICAMPLYIDTPNPLIFPPTIEALNTLTLLISLPISYLIFGTAATSPFMKALKATTVPFSSILTIMAYSATNLQSFHHKLGSFIQLTQIAKPNISSTLTDTSQSATYTNALNTSNTPQLQLTPLACSVTTTNAHITFLIKT